MKIEDIIDKPSIEAAPSSLADFDRMLLDRNITCLNATISCALGRSDIGRELDEFIKNLNREG